MSQIRDDKIIVTELNGGSEAAFRELYFKYSRVTYRQALDLCGPNRHEAEDVVQDVYTKIWEKRSDLDPGLKISNLLYTMTHNTCLDRIAKKKSAQRHLSELIREGEKLEMPVTRNENELAIKLQRAIDQITAPTVRNVVQSRYIDQKSYQEISSETGLKIPTLRIFMNRGMNILRKIVKKDMG